ncbi:hypothetical protein NC651_012025 [Populus alba x Populus x berolinensis]|nr:hypothetical protein NC651_012025 [Populus alba x Populus x berolinensis]
MVFCIGHREKKKIIAERERDVHGGYSVNKAEGWVGGGSKRLSKSDLFTRLTAMTGVLYNCPKTTILDIKEMSSDHFDSYVVKFGGGISVDELCVGRRWCWRFFVMVHSGVSAVLPPFVKKVSEARVVEMTNKLCEKLLHGKDQHRDIASIALKTLASEVTAISCWHSPTLDHPISTVDKRNNKSLLNSNQAAVRKRTVHRALVRTGTDIRHPISLEIPHLLLQACQRDLLGKADS